MSSHDSAIRSGLFFSALALVLALCSTSPLHPITITLDHETLAVSPAGAIGVYPDELLTLVVTNTSRECYTFNLSEVKAEEREGGLL